MAADVIRTELKASGDRCVRAGLRGAIEHLAGRHGMSAAEQREFANEVDAECCKFTARGEAGAFCEVIIEEQQDQIEVRVRPSPESTLTPTTSRHTVLADGSKHHSDGKLSRRDGQPAHVTDNGHHAVSLVRHFHKNPAHS